jgi:addiction module HigA family antidote
MNNIKTIYPTHPGEIIKEELSVRGISQKQFAEYSDLSYTMLNEILNSKRPVTTEIALVIESALGISAELLINMQSSYNLQIARQDKKINLRLNKIRKACASLLS